MRAVFSLIAGLALMFAFAPTEAIADCNGAVVGPNCQATTNQGGQGGAGGAGGSASAAAAASASQQQSNTNVFVPTNINTNQQGQHQGQGQQQGQAQGQRQSQNNKQTIAPSQTVNIAGDDIPAQAPAIFAPNLTSSPEACMGSVSAGGGAGFGGTSFGITFGTTWTNDQCQDRMNARTLSSLGQNQAALEYLAATNPKIATALKQAGVKVAVNEPVLVSGPGGSVTEQLKDAGLTSTTGGAKIEKKDVPQAKAAELPACGDGRPAKLTASGFYTCSMYR